MEWQFKVLAKEAFNFLVKDYGFVCAETTPTLVTFTGAGVFVGIDFDSSRSYEVSCSVGREDDLVGSRRLPFDLGEIMRVHGIAPRDAHSAFQVTTNESLGKFLKVLAGELARYGQKILAGDEREFRQLAGQRDKECTQYADDSKMRQVRTALATAWTNRDYRQVIRLLDPVVHMLSDAEKKKLHYAKSHL